MPGHRQFIVGAKPRVDVNGAYLGSRTRCIEKSDNTIDTGHWQRGDVLTKIYGKVCLSVVLVRGDGRAKAASRFRLAARFRSPSL